MEYELRGIPSSAISRNEPIGKRIETQVLTIVQDLVLNGSSFSTVWRENSIASGGGKAYAEFVIPMGYYMALYERILNPQGDSMKYKVYPSGTYTKGADKVDDGDSFAKTRNLRSMSSNLQDPLTRVNVTTPPAATDFVIYIDMFGSAASSSGNKSSGALNASGSFLLLGPGTTFLLEITNGGASNFAFSSELYYSLISEEAIPDEGTLL